MFQIVSVYSLIEKKDYSYLYVDAYKTGRARNRTSIRLGKILMEDVDLGEPTSFLDHVYLGCTQRECQISKDTVDNY